MDKIKIIKASCGCEFKSEDGKHPKIDFGSIDLRCRKTWDLIGSGATKGVFQLESHLGREWAKRVKPSNIEDLAALVALIRPGCLRAMSGDPPKSMTQRYCDRKNGQEITEYFHESLEPILNKTYGVLVYQEQAMKIAQVIAGFNLQEADVLRKAIGKKKADIMTRVEGQFIKGCQNEGIVNEDQAKEIFGWIRESQRYSFNKSHAVSYAKNAYWSAYCKAHFPHEFFCSYLRGSAWKQDTHYEVYELVNDARLSDIDVTVPSFSSIRKTFYIEKDYIRFGLSDIKQVGSSAVDKIQEKASEVELLLNKSTEQWTWEEYLIFFSKSVASTVNVAMASCGAFDGFRIARNRMLYELEIWNRLTVKEMAWIQETKHWPSLKDSLLACQPTKKEGGGCSTYKRADILADLIKTLEKPPHSLEDTPAWIAWAEEKYLGVGITCNRVDGCEDSIRANTTCKEFIDGKSGHMIVAVEVNKVKQIITKNGKSPGSKMAFLTVSDSSCALDNVVCFPSQWKENQGTLQEGNTILLQGERDKRKGGFIVQKVWQI
tara:strand:+ start:39342 stop:40979 length:1638 start_codon:yes stop_codon:yes gene_type:complete